MNDKKTNISRHYAIGGLLALLAFFDVIGPGSGCGERRGPPPEVGQAHREAASQAQAAEDAEGRKKAAARHAAEAAAAESALVVAALGAPAGDLAEMRAAGDPAVEIDPSGAGLGLTVASAAPARAQESSNAAAAVPLLDFVELHVGGAVAGTELPLIVAIHGLGDSPEGFSKFYAHLGRPARVLVPRGKRPHGNGSTWFRLSDGPEGTRLADVTDSADRLVALVKARMAAAPTRGKPVVTGFSQGGILSFWLAAHYPEVFAAALPIAGRLTADTFPPAAAPGADKKPCKVIAFHGEADNRIAYAAGKQTVEALAKAGFDATLRSFAGVGHSIPPAVRDVYFPALEAALP